MPIFASFLTAAFPRASRARGAGRGERSCRCLGKSGSHNPGIVALSGTVVTCCQAENGEIL